MAKYVYLFSDLMTNAVIAELPLTTVSFENRLNGAGSLTASLPLGDPGVATLDPFTATQPGRTAVYVDRDGVLVWGGILWTRSYDSSASILRLQAAEFWSYLERRLVIQNLTYLGADEGLVVGDVITNTLAAPAGNPGFTPFVSSDWATATTFIDQVFNDYELKGVGQTIITLSQQQGGFDIVVDVAYDSTGTPAKTINFSFPRRGLSFQDSGLLFDYPGNILRYTWPEDASKMATSVYLYGAGAGNVMLQSSSTAGSMLDAGWPLLESALSYKDQTTQDVLDAYTFSQLANLQQPIVLPALTVHPGLDPVLGSYTVGDEARIRIQDRRFPAGIDTYYRITAVKTTPQETAHESVELTMTIPWTG